jgi:hypothetical protein
MRNRTSLLTPGALAGAGCAVLLAAGRPAAAAPVQWAGNGHFYEAVSVPGGISWEAANLAAQSAGGYLATLTSLAENDFAFSLIDSPLYWGLDTAGNSQGPYLGGLQVGGPEPAGGWQWVSGEAWSFTNWRTGQPDNASGVEDRLQFFEFGSGRTPQWNDVNGGVTFSKGYVVEYNALPSAAVPEPGTLALAAFTVLPLAGIAARRRRTAQENGSHA